MQGESTRRFAGAIQSWDHLLMDIDHLASPVNFQAGESVVQDGRRPGSIKWRTLNRVFGRWFSKI